MGYTGTITCSVCGKTVTITGDTNESFLKKMRRQKYCEECRVIKLKESIALSRKKERKKAKENEPLQINFREFDKGYERFWKKRGLEPPKVDAWGNCAL